MKMIPSFRISNMKKAIAFYTQVLDFELRYPDASPDEWVVDLVNGDAELMLTSLEGDQRAAINVYALVDDVDALFQKYLQRGLKIPDKKDSPVHQRPIDQTWGMREFYVTDEDGNTVRFGRPIK